MSQKLIREFVSNLPDGRHLVSARNFGLSISENCVVYTVNGKLHREDGPALIVNHISIWYSDGKIHRQNNPAATNPVMLSWFINDKKHKEDGPAHIQFISTKTGLYYPIEEKHEYWLENSLIRTEIIEAICHKKHGKLHREDGPAIELPHLKEWRINDKLHREDGPAIESIISRTWCLNGKRHREDGPAIEYANGETEWYYNGRKYDVSSPEELLVAVLLN